MNNKNEFWGPSLWRTIHCICAKYTPDKSEQFLTFIYNLADLLPCPKCGVHLSKNLQKFPPHRYLGSNHDLFFWSWILHDTVNGQCGKKSISFVDAKDEYFSAFESCKGCDK